MSKIWGKNCLKNTNRQKTIRQTKNIRHLKFKPKKSLDKNYFFRQIKDHPTLASLICLSKCACHVSYWQDETVNCKNKKYHFKPHLLLLITRDRCIRPSTQMFVSWWICRLYRIMVNTGCQCIWLGIAYASNELNK